LQPLSPVEREIWLLDQRINDRGITVDLPTVSNAKKIVEQQLSKLNGELHELTGGAVNAATQIAKLTGWLKAEGVELPGTGDELGRHDIEHLLAREDLPGASRRALEIRLEAAKTSTAKLDAYLSRTSADGRLRESLLYQGASRTGRWAGRGAQLQNLPRGGIAHLEQALEFIGNGLPAEWLGLFGPPLEVISACLRPMLTAAPGCDLISADYNAIEARGTAWLAGAERMLNIFRRGDDPYLDMAARIYGRPADTFNKISRERQLGKIAVLGLGYQMGAERFGHTCAAQGVVITAKEAETIKRIYRETNPEIVQLWRTLEAAAIRALQDPQRWVNVANGRIGFLKVESRLYLRLPSGRCLIYANPRYEQVETQFGPRWGLTFDGISSSTQRWEGQQLYGGKLTENAVQAICRDLLGATLLRLETAGYPVVLHVHDEIIAEVPEGTGDVEEFERLMAEGPEWAVGFPIKAEGWRAKRFGKP
jgi:DNA polymerase